MSLIDRYVLPGNILDRVLELERQMKWLEDNVAMPVADPGSGEGAITYIEILNQLEEGPDIDLADDGTTITVGRGGDTILVFDSGGNPIAEYAATSTGLDLASAAADAGDVVWIPAVTIAGDHVLTAGVHYIGVSRYASQLTGQITTGTGTTLECVTVNRTANDVNILKGIIGPAAGTARIRDCDVTTTQSGTGASYAVSCENGGDLEVWLCGLDGQSVGGIGFGGYRAGAGDLYIYSSRCVGSAYPLSE